MSQEKKRKSENAMTDGVERKKMKTFPSEAKQMKTIEGCIKVRYIRPSWHSLLETINVVVFGDSYSSSLDDDSLSNIWVNHLVHTQMKEHKINMHNFAVPGDTVEDNLATQIKRFLASRVISEDSPSGVSLLNSSNTLYVIWLGINDCGQAYVDNLDEVVELIFDAAHDLYVKAGARNFLFVDIPPINRSPGAISLGTDIAENYDRWNELLASQAEDFAESARQATVIVFSSHQVLSDILDNPEDYGFNESDIGKEESGIWEDQLHVTSAVHKIFAGQIHEALLSITAHAKDGG